MMQQLELFAAPATPPAPDLFFGRCHCGWLLAGWHCRAFDQPGWARVRHLWLYVPEDD